LKANGYDAAAALWDRVLKGDKKAAIELRDNAGVYGVMCISEDGNWHGL
jgi:hypothetical protein